MTRKITSLISVALALALLAACVPSVTPTATPAAPLASTQPPTSPPSTKAPEKPAPAAASKPSSSEAPYYQGKTIEVLVESSAGGGTDTIARITAAYLPKYIPGNPRMLIRNQGGAGGVVANNSFYEKAKPDGFSLLQNSSSPISMQLRGRDIIKFDLTKYRAVAHISRAESIMMVRKGMLPKLSDTSGTPLRVGTKEGEETWMAVMLWGQEYLGWNFRYVLGFAGTSEMELAFRRGELDVFGTANAFIVRRMQQEGMVDTLTTIGSLKGGKFIGRPDFPEVPTFETVLGNKKPTGVAWEAYMSWVGPNNVDKFLVAPPKTPDNVMAILTDSYTKMAKDQQFDEMMKKTVTDVYEIGIGKETEATLKEVLSASPEAQAFTKQLLLKNGLAAK